MEFTQNTRCAENSSRQACSSKALRFSRPRPFSPLPNTKIFWSRFPLAQALSHAAVRAAEHETSSPATGRHARGGEATSPSTPGEKLAFDALGDSSALQTPPAPRVLLPEATRVASDVTSPLSRFRLLGLASARTPSPCLLTARSGSRTVRVTAVVRADAPRPSSSGLGARVWASRLALASRFFISTQF